MTPYWKLHFASIAGLLLYLATTLVHCENGLKLTVYPRAILVGNSVWVTCRVSPDNKNRRLLYGISGVQASERQLDGKDAPITWGPTEFKKIPCDAGPAYCIVDRQGERPLQEMLQLNVGGCEGQ